MPTITRFCDMTDQVEEFHIEGTDQIAVDYWLQSDYHNRPKVQDTFGHLDADAREFILSGMTPDIWDTYMGPEDEDFDN